MTKTDSTGAHAEPGRFRQHLAHVAANLCGFEKQQAAATFKGGFGFHPIGVWCDNTTELLAISLRPGNAGSNHAGDNIDVLRRAVAQIPPVIAGTCWFVPTGPAPPMNCWTG